MSTEADLTIKVGVTGAASTAKTMEEFDRAIVKSRKSIKDFLNEQQAQAKWEKSEEAQRQKSYERVKAQSDERKRQEKERARQAHLAAEKEIADQEELRKKTAETNKELEEQNNSKKNRGGRTRKIARTGLAAVEAAMLVSSAIGTSRDRKGAQGELEKFSATNNLDSRVLTQQMDSVAQVTNQSLSEVTNAFMLLNGLGLDASSDALISYTKLAKGVGEDLSNVVLRVSSATDGHFRALTLAGINVEQQGDELTLSHGKFSKTIKNTSAEIQTALQELAESEFNTVIRDEEKTVSGAMNRLATNIEGSVAVIGGGMDDALSWVSKIPGVQEGVDGLGNIVQKGANLVADGANRVEQSTKILLADRQRSLAPDEDSRQVIADRFIEQSKREEADRERARGSDNSQKASDTVPPSLLNTPLPSPESTNLSDDTSTNKAIEDAQKTSDIINETHKQTTEAHKLELDTQDANLEQSNAFRLEQYTQQGNALATYQNANLTTLRDTLNLEENKVSESYQRRLQIIKDNTPEGSEKQGKLTDKVTSDFAGDMNRLTDQFMQEKEFTSASNAEKITMLEEFYNKRDEIINGFTALSGEKKKELQEKFAQDEIDTLENLEGSKDKITRASTEKTFNDVLGLTKKFAGEQSEAYRAMFAATKAFALAESIINIQTGISDAVAKGFPQNIPLIAGVLSQASGIVSTIQGTNLSGAYDHGGMIPSGSQGIVGEFGPELISGPAIVTSRRTTADQDHSQNQMPPVPAEPPVVNIRQINAFDTGVINDFIGSDEGEQVILNIIRRNPETLRSLAAA